MNIIDSTFFSNSAESSNSSGGALAFDALCNLPWLQLCNLDSVFQGALLVGRVGNGVEAAGTAAGGDGGPARGELHANIDFSGAAHSTAAV